ncbi:S9 family peptidase [Cryptosporangium arvum]|uniref:S9 family peptidase n=1 Tax=Cryptosporangium arvum TaxID=80871 RepID=UPI000559BCC1|nr:S9 family peptidase [Cryptosporangium arvum]
MTTPPVAKRIPFTRSFHGDDVVDDYAWLADRENPDTIPYLTAENEYTEQATAHLAGLRETLFDEIKRRTQETDLSVPSRKGGWWHYSRTEEGKQYGIHCRLRAEPGRSAPPETVEGTPLPGEEVVLDENALAGDEAFLALGAYDISPDDRLLAYSTDFAGDERFTLRIRDLETGKDLADEVPNTSYGTAWSADATELFYLTVDDAWRPHRVWRHTVGTPAENDTMVFEEPDERFWVGVGLARSEAYVIIQASSKTTSEVRVLDATAPNAEPRLIAARRDGVEYSVDHQAAGPNRPERFLVLHNDGAENFTLATAPIDAPADWAPLIPHDPAVRLADVDAFAGHVVVHLRKDGLTGLRVLTEGEPDRDLTFPEAVYTVEPASNPDYETTLFRLHYTSLVTPDSVYDCDLATGELTLRKQQPVLGGYDPEDYEQFREWATAPDGTKVPISIVARKDTPRDGSAPCLLYGYGAYEISIDPWFSVARLSLLDRGFVFAVAHVRGGGELGRRWYDDGKLLRKQNTFTDFIAAAQRVVEAGWTSTERLVARGGSAGGLLMGAIANMAPEAFRAIVADVPFVDALTSILDPSLPLTVTEWEEWGDPLHDPEAYAYIRSYAPYDNVEARPYPALLVLAGLNDTRVLYHEPAKWVAKLRAVGANDVLLRTEMGAGHSGPSGRYDAWREAAFATAFIIDVAGAAQA